MRKTSVTALFAGGVLVLVAGCGDMTVGEKYDHLRDVANKGADAHFALINENKDTSRDVCEQHYKVFVPDGAPSEDPFSGTSSKEWTELSVDYFVDSCVKGEPRVIQTRSSGPSAPESSSATSSSASAPAAAATNAAPAAGN